MKYLTTNEKPEILLDHMVQNGQLLPSQTDTLLRLYKHTNQSIEYLLLTLRLVSEKTLQIYLQDLYGISSIVDPFMLPDEDAIKLFSAKDIEKLNIIPQKITADSLYVLVEKPIREGVIERIGKITGKYAVPCVVNPFRFKFLKHICYGASIPSQEKKIALEILEGAGKQYAEFTYNFAHDYDPESGIKPQYPNDDPLFLASLPIDDTTDYIGEVSPMESIPLLDNDVTVFIETIDKSRDIEDIRISSGEHSIVSASLDENFKPLNPQNLDGYFSEIKSKYELPDIFYSFGARAMRTVALFSCSRGFVLGWTGAGQGLHQIKLDGVMLPDDRGTLISDIIEQKYYLGKVENHIVNRRLLNILGGDTDDIIIGSAITIGKRPVMVIVCIVDDEAKAPVEMDLMKQLCEYSEKAIVRLIKDQKKDNFK